MSTMNDFVYAPNSSRYIELENGNKLNMQRRDPYGHIHLSLERGQLPDSLKDAAFTDWSKAEQAARSYVAQRQEVVAQVKHKAPKD